MRIKNERLASTTCPECGAMLDDATNTEDASLKPEPGDISCCIGCAVVLEYQDDMQMRKLSADEFLALPDDVRLEIAKYARAIHKVHEEITRE